MTRENQLWGNGMNDQERKARLIVISALVCDSLILVELLLLHLHFGPSILNLPFWLAEFILAVSGLLALKGWLAQSWVRLCAIGVFLAVISWTLFWPIAFILFLPGMRPNP